MYQPQKIVRSCYIAILLNPKESLQQIPSLQNQTNKMLEIFVVKSTNIWPNLILILPSRGQNNFLTSTGQNAWQWHNFIERFVTGYSVSGLSMQYWSQPPTKFLNAVFHKK